MKDDKKNILSGNPGNPDSPEKAGRSAPGDPPRPEGDVREQSGRKTGGRPPQDGSWDASRNTPPQGQDPYENVSLDTEPGDPAPDGSAVAGTAGKAPRFSSLRAGGARIRRSFHENARLFFLKAGAGEGEQAESRRLRARMVAALFYAVGGFLFTRIALPYGTRPVGFALFAASSGADAVYLLFGLMAGAWGGALPLLMILAPVLAFLTRLLIHRSAPGRSLFGEMLTVRMALACATAFLYGFAACAYEGFALPAVLSLLVGVVTAPLLTYFFACGLGNGAMGKHSLSGSREIGRCLLLFFAVYSLEKQGLFGLSLGLLAGYFIVLIAAVRGGALRAGGLGLLVGLARGIGVFSLQGLALSPIFALSGLFMGLFAPYQLLLATGGGALLSVGLQWAVAGSGGLWLFAGEILFATLLFLPCARAGLFSGQTVGLFPALPLAFTADLTTEPESGRRRKKAEVRRLAALSSAFDELSVLLSELAEKSRLPGRYGVKEAVDGVFAHTCSDCPLHEVCYEKDPAELCDLKERMTDRFLKGELADKSLLSPVFAGRCRQGERLLRDSGRAVEDLVEASLRRDKTELFATDYAAMAELLAAASDTGEEEAPDRELCRRAGECFRTLGIRATAFSAYGSRRKTLQILGIQIGSLSLSAGELQKELSKALGLPLTEPRFDFSGESVTMMVESLPPLCLETVTAGATRAGEGVSGDTVTVFADGDARSFQLICDGMGTGRVAALSSRISAAFLEKLLGAGVPRSAAFQMMSVFLRSRSEECHATADLLEVDLYRSKGIFTKCGAAPSFVWHKGNLLRVEARSAPLGILRDLSMAEIPVELAPGDLIFLMSDGLAPLFETGAPLIQCLPDLTGLSLEAMRDAILAVAPDNDDVSLILCRVKENPCFPGKNRL